LVVGLVAMPGSALAVTEEDFFLNNAQDLVDVCSVEASNPLYVASIHFCHGFVSGAGQYHQSMASGPNIDPFFCLPDPLPTRREAISMFLAWAQGQELTNEAAVDGLMRFAVETWPCE
jgi:hypothetical protein